MNIELSPEFCTVPCRAVMNKLPPKADATENVLELTNRLLSIDYKAVIVYEDKEPIGLITLKDIMKWLVQTEDKGTLVVKDLISVPLISVELDTTIQEALNIMEKYSIKYVGVQEQKTLKGLLNEDGVKEICEKYPHYLREYSKLRSPA
ncbi:MAG: CBS domain-containing protein [Candidatus Bathyarchaeota archaeon]|nr:CBS domain-containing protein [Candidatus Bathyarchaeota archaeon]